MINLFIVSGNNLNCDGGTTCTVMCKWTYVECLLILLIYVILNCTLSSCDVLGFTHLQMTPQM